MKVGAILFINVTTSAYPFFILISGKQNSISSTEGDAFSFSKFKLVLRVL